MGRQLGTPPPERADAIPPPMLTPGQWAEVVCAFRLSPQQARIVRLILQNKPDKQIAVELNLNRYTIRTYLKRIFDRLGIDNRLGLVLHVFDLCMKNQRCPRCAP
jgi:DNA-binding CsgD family transcriptional regulator